MSIDRDDDQAVYEALLDLLREETEGNFHVSEDGSYIELSRWGGEDLTAEPVRLHTTVSAIAEHLRGMEDGVDLFFPDVQPIIGAVQLFSVHIAEAIGTRKPGETELIVRPGGVWSAPPGSSE